jgi:hypothetical protein
MPNENIKLSRSNPVRRARSDTEGGFQYAGTNRGSVRPSSEVQRLTTSISCLLSRISSEPWKMPTLRQVRKGLIAVGKIGNQKARLC